MKRVIKKKKPLKAQRIMGEPRLPGYVTLINEGYGYEFVEFVDTENDLKEMLANHTGSFLDKLEVFEIGKKISFSVSHKVEVKIGDK